MTTSTRRLLLVGGISVLTVGLLLWIGRPSGDVRGSTASSGVSVLAAEPATADLGTVSMAKGVVTRTFAVANPSAAPVTVTKLFTSCMCTKATLIAGENRKGPFGMPGHGSFIPSIKETIAPGASATVEVAFDPAAHGPAGVGRIQRTVTLETAEGSPLEIDFQAEVIP